MNKYKNIFFCISIKDFFNKHRIVFFKLYFYSFIRPLYIEYSSKIALTIQENSILDIEKR